MNKKGKDTIRLRGLLGIGVPVIQAPMAGADTAQLAIAVSRAGGLGSLACAMLSTDQVGEQYRFIREYTDAPVNLNFFCHRQSEKAPAQQRIWLNRLRDYYREYAIDPADIPAAVPRMPFNEDYCRVIEALRCPVVSFHFGLPPKNLLERVRATGSVVMSSATTVEEGEWLEANGCDVVIAQGKEAGGHRGMFLTSDLTTQLPMMELVSLLSDKLSVPIVAAGGLADAPGMQQAFASGAAAAQLGTAYLFCEEARVAPLHRQALAGSGETALTNVFSGRPARGIVNRFIAEVGPISPEAPDFPYAADLVAPLRQASERAGSTDFMQLWSGEIRKPHGMNAYDFTRHLYDQLGPT